MYGLFWYACLFGVILGCMKREVWLIALGLFGMWYF